MHSKFIHFRRNFGTLSNQILHSRQALKENSFLLVDYIPLSKCNSKVCSAVHDVGCGRILKAFCESEILKGNKLEQKWHVMGSSSAAPWRHLLLSSIQANSHLKHHSYFQFATVAPNQTPSNRTVVFRGFQDNSDKILINTDIRTRKIDDLRQWPFAEICWYFTDTWEQFRISGPVDIIDGTNPDPDKLKQREKSWFAGSLRSRLQYTTPTPGVPCVNELQSEAASLDPSVGPVGAFCVLVLEPNQVDYLNLKSNDRQVFTSASREGGKVWTSDKVNP